MALDIQSYVSKPIRVEAVQVTLENIVEVAAWCGGEKRTTMDGDKFIYYIRVDVKRPRYERQTKAFVGDWVLKSPTMWKVYTPSGFKNSFELDSDVDARVVMSNNEESAITEAAS